MWEYRKFREDVEKKENQKNWGESRWKRVIRFRLGNEMKASAYWEEEERKMCRVCEGEVETWEHTWENCREWKNGEGNWQEVVERILEGEGEGEGWMREVEREREREEEGKEVRKGRKREREGGMHAERRVGIG